MGKKNKDEWVDDGRVIYNMEAVEDINSAPLGRPFKRRRGSFDPFGQVAEKKESVKLTKEEQRMITRGVVMAYGVLLLIALVVMVILIYLMPA